MSPNYDAIYDAAVQLSEPEQLELASRLLERIPATVVELALDDPNLEERLNARVDGEQGEMTWSQLRDEQ